MSLTIAHCTGINVTNSLDVENDVYSKRVRFSAEKTYVLHQNFTDYVYGKEMELCGDQKIFLEVTSLVFNQVENLGVKFRFREHCSTV